MNLELPEGACMDGVYVFTGPELRRLLVKTRREAVKDYAAADAMAAYARMARREAYRRSGAKRYARYKQLRTQFGESCRQKWTVHLAELERRAAAC